MDYSLKSVVAFESGRKERTTSSQHGAYNLGNTHPTMANNNGKQMGNHKQIPSKFRLSSDWGLQPDPMKSESVVIADQHAAVNTFSGLVQIKGAWQFKKQNGVNPFL